MNTALPSWYQRGDGRARIGQVVVEDRLGVLGDRDDLAAEPAARSSSSGARLVGRRRVCTSSWLASVYSRSPGLKVSNARMGGAMFDDRSGCAARRARARVAAVGEVLQQDRDLAVGDVAEARLLRRQRVQEALRRVGHQVVAGRGIVDELQLARLDVLHLSLRRMRRQQCSANASAALRRRHVVRIVMPGRPLPSRYGPTVAQNEKGESPVAENSPSRRRTP